MGSDFRKRMGLQAEMNLKEAQNRFLNRVKASIFRWLTERNEYVVFWDTDFIFWISEQLGQPWSDRVLSRENGRGYWSNLTIEEMAGSDFVQTLEVLEKCYQYIDEGRPKERGAQYYFGEKISVDVFDKKMEQIMLLGETDIGVFWKNGKFYASGAKELDDALISDQLDWLSNFPEVQKQFSVALGHYQRSLQDVSAGKDAMTNAYTSIELLSKQFLNNDKNFESNSNALVDNLGLTVEYRQVVHYYKQIAHEYSSRHAGSDLGHAEVEGFVYLTGLLMRLIIRKILDV